MTNRDDISNQTSQLRRQAEEIALEKPARSLEEIHALSAEEIQQRFHELRVHQIELEMQNEELRTAQVEIEAGRDRYYDLYDLAPVGYCTLSEHGLILEANLTVATLLRTTRGLLVNQPISRFILKDDQNIYSLHRKRLFETGEPQKCDLRLVKPDGDHIWAHMKGTVAQADDGAPLYRVVLSDISGRKRTEEALKRSERFLRSTVDGLTAHIVVLDDRGEIILTNKAYRDFGAQNGIEPRTVSEGVNYLAVCDTATGEHSEEATHFADGIREVLSGKLPFLELEYPCHSPSEKRWFVAHVTPFDDEGPRQVIVAHENITERKHAEEAMREQRDFSESLIETAQVIILVLDTQGRIVRFNPCMEELAGYALDEVKGLDWFETFLTPEIDRTIKPLFQKTVADVHTSGNVNPIIAKDGRTILVEWYNKTLKDKDGRTVGILAIGQDLTGREQAENNLKMAHEKLLTILDSIDSTVYVADLNTYEILFMNQKMITVFGGNKTGDLCYRAFRNNSEPCACCTNDQLINKDGNPAGVCMWHDRNPVTGRYYINHDRAIEWTDGRLVRMQIATDITDLKNMEAQLQQAQKMEAIGTLAGGIAHDFNNILGAILGYAEMAQEDSPAGSTLRRDIDQIVKAGHRARELVKQILAFSRQAETEHIPLQPAFIIQEAIKMLRSSLPSTIIIKQNIDIDAGLILASATQIHQIVMNLCTNAFHAMEKTGGTLAISLEKKTLNERDIADKPGVQPGDFVQLSIGDTGPGIAPELWGKIFDPYFTTKEVGKGTGMGLAIIHGIVKSYGGCVLFKSHPGKGTVFQVLLPVIAEGTVVENKQEDTVQFGNERILFIDDEELLAELSKSMLERLGYQVTVQSSSLEALTIFQNQPDKFDLVITDQTMPGMTGSDLARRILQIRPFMPIILCTGYSSIITKEKAKSLGIKGFAMKPLARKSIAVLIREVLDGGRRVS